MGEIKSTLDLVLEKTKGLTLSVEEKAAMQLQEALQKVPGYAERVLDGVLSAEALTAEIGGLPPEIREPVRRETARQMSLILDLDPHTDPLLNALESLAEPAWASLLGIFKRCRSDYRQARATGEQQARNRILAALAAAGIQGSAVVAKVASDPLWTAEDGRMRQQCEAHLEALRTALA
jgi:hypothetical protein